MCSQLFSAKYRLLWYASFWSYSIENSSEQINIKWCKWLYMYIWSLLAPIIIRKHMHFRSDIYIYIFHSRNFQLNNGPSVFVVYMVMREYINIESLLSSDQTKLDIFRKSNFRYTCVYIHIEFFVPSKIKCSKSGKLGLSFIYISKHVSFPYSTYTLHADIKASPCILASYWHLLSGACLRLGKFS